MANITAQMVKELRERTGAGMMDCKAALQETNGDMEGAGVVDEHFDVVGVGLGLGERVVQGDVDVVGDRRVGIQLGDDDAVRVGVEEVGQPDDDDVVVVDERDAQGRSPTVHGPDRNHP